jgi:hypothetical protein
MQQPDRMADCLPRQRGNVSLTASSFQAETDIDPTGPTGGRLCVGAAPLGD